MKRTPALLGDRAPELLAAAFGVAWFLAAGGWRALSPTAFDWMGSEAAQHVLGWLFFRESRWGLPLGRIDGFVWPSGTTVGFTDSNPLLALVGKLASPLLPHDFQYVGLWLAACFALQGWCGARVTAIGSARPADRFLGGALFALAPPLLQRRGHDTLCAHAALLMLLALHLAPVPDEAAARRASRGAIAVALGLCFIHPYLAVMAVALALALLVRLSAMEALLPRGAALGYAGVLVAGPAAIFALLGYFTSAPSHGTGFGLFSTDLAWPVSSFGVSAFVPAIPSLDVHWEGNAYFGAGGLALLAVALGLALRRWRPPRRRLVALAPLAIACLALFAFALSDRIRLAGHELLDLRRLYRPIGGVLGPFRSSGRFVWPLHYLALAAAVLLPLELLRDRPRLATALLAAAAALQLVDLAPRAVGQGYHDAPWRPRDPRWALAAGRYRHLALVPPQVVAIPGPCRGLVYRDDGYWAPLAYEAHALGLTVNSGYLARGAGERLGPSCEALMADVAAGALRSDTVYVPHPDQLPALQRAGARCGRLDGYFVCVAPSGAFAQALAGR
ncbi:MAG TPA: DUF6311 domain-containing protein [Anaeromyxobacteraceae bacterium]